MLGRPPKDHRPPNVALASSPEEEGWSALGRFFDTSDALLAVLDGEGRFVRLNDRWEAVLGYPGRELLGQRAGSLVHPEDGADWERLFADDGSPEPVGLRLRARSGAYRWLSWSAVQREASGIVLCMAQDVTAWVERWGAGPSLRGLSLPVAIEVEDPAREIACTVCDFTRFFQLSPDLMAIADPEGRLANVNGAWHALLGHSPKEILGTALLDLVHPKDRTRAAARWRRVLAEEPVKDVTSRVRMACGGTRVIQWRASVDPHRGVVHLVGRDRDEVHRAREGEAYIRAIMESVPDPILSLDPAFRIRDLNAAAADAFGYGAEALLGEPIDLLVPGLRELVEAHADAPWYDRDRPLTVERTGVRQGHAHFPVRVAVTDAGLGSGGLLTVLARDLTQERLDRARYLDEVRSLEASAIHVRLANELHDGLLQSLTGASLQLEIIQKLFPWDPTAAHERLLELQKSLVDEQRELRFFVDEFKSGGEGWGSHDAPIASRLRSMLERVERIWSVRCPLTTEIEIEPSVARSHEILRIIHEASVNATRHGRATDIDIRLRCLATGTSMRLSDNGRGFAFDGRWEHAELVARRVGPSRLKQRVIDNGGTVEIESSSSGAILTAWLPCETDQS
jgi:PAS domain S-box-containing protein